jgi:hypothetical protein
MIQEKISGLFDGRTRGGKTLLNRGVTERGSGREGNRGITVALLRCALAIKKAFASSSLAKARLWRFPSIRSVTSQSRYTFPPMRRLRGVIVTPLWWRLEKAFLSQTVANGRANGF